MKVHHILTGHAISRKAVAQAIELSDNKYCSVAATLRPNVEIQTASRSSKHRVRLPGSNQASVKKDCRRLYSFPFSNSSRCATVGRVKLHSRPCVAAMLLPVRRTEIFPGLPRRNTCAARRFISPIARSPKRVLTGRPCSTTTRRMHAFPKPCSASGALISRQVVPGRLRCLQRLSPEVSRYKRGTRGLNYSAASLLRMGQFSEAAARYEEYINRFPNGERIDTAHLNMIDTLREANRPSDALVWVTRTKQRFAGSATETNAMFAALRLYVAEGEWSNAVLMADQLSQRTFARAVQTSRSEVAYLKAFSLEQAGRKDEAFSAYLAVPDGIESYYGWLASQGLRPSPEKHGPRSWLNVRTGLTLRSQASPILIRRRTDRQYSAPPKSETSIPDLFLR